MPLSRSAEYALRAVVRMADQPDDRLNTRQIAQRTHVPPGYMSKVLQVLARAGLVESNPGRTGGFRLTRAADQISVLQVVRAVDPPQRILRCPLGLKSHRHQLCPLHRRLDDVAALVERAYATTTIAEIVTESTRGSALCEDATAATSPRRHGPAH